MTTPAEPAAVRIRSAAPDQGLVARLASKARGLSERLKAAETSAAAATAKVAQLEAANAELAQRADTSASAKQVAELQAKLRTIEHRKVFDRLAAEKKADPTALEDLWQLSGYRAEGDAPDEAAIGALIDEQKGKRGYLFQPDGQPQPQGSPIVEPPRPGPGSGRGGAPAVPAGKFAVSKANMNNTEWMRANGKALNEAFKAGTVHWVD